MGIINHFRDRWEYLQYHGWARCCAVFILALGASACGLATVLIWRTGDGRQAWTLVGLALGALAFSLAEDLTRVDRADLERCRHESSAKASSNNAVGRCYDADGAG